MKKLKTINDLFAATWKAVWSEQRYQQSGWAEEVKRLYHREIEPVFGSMPAAKVTVGKIKTWHRGIASTTTANRARSVLARLFSFAIEEEWLPLGMNPCTPIRKRAEASRDRFATDEEIRAVAAKLTEYEDRNPVGVAFLWILMFTGSRPRAIERARREDLHQIGDHMILRFNGKTGKESVVLPPQAMRVLERLPAREDGLLVGIPMPRKLWEKIRREAGCPDLWARDWRRTFATVGLSSGHAMSQISEVLNHKSAQTTKIYAKLIDTVKVDTAVAIANRMQVLTGIDPMS